MFGVFKAQVKPTTEAVEWLEPLDQFCTEVWKPSTSLRGVEGQSAPRVLG